MFLLEKRKHMRHLFSCKLCGAQTFNRKVEETCNTPSDNIFQEMRKIVFT